MKVNFAGFPLRPGKMRKTKHWTQNIRRDWEFGQAEKWEQWKEAVADPEICRRGVQCGGHFIFD